MPHDVYIPELTPELLVKIRGHINNDLPIGSTTAKEWLRAMIPAAHERDSLKEALDDAEMRAVDATAERNDIQVEIERLRNLYERERSVSEHFRKVMDRAYDANRSQSREYIKLEDRYRQIKAERDDYRAELEWYGGGSEDGGEKARDVILRYKRGDGADGSSAR